MTRSFTIKDKAKRTWGAFEVSDEHNKNIHGYLIPQEDFQEVQEIFAHHDEVFSDPEGNTDETIQKILDLGAYLVDNNTGESVDIRGIIFINENLLVTCRPQRVGVCNPDLNV